MADSKGSVGKQDDYLRVKGFLVEVSGAQAGKVVDGNWKRVTGGAEVIEVAETTIGNDIYKTFAPGHSHITPLVLEGGMTKDRKIIYEWIKAIEDGKDFRKMITITPLSIEMGKATKKHVYHDCFIEQYEFPALDSEIHDPLHEKVVIRANRYEIQ